MCVRVCVCARLCVCEIIKRLTRKSSCVNARGIPGPGSRSGQGEVPPSQVRMGEGIPHPANVGTPIQNWEEGTPLSWPGKRVPPCPDLSRGYPHPDLGRGAPPSWPGKGVPLHPDLGRRYPLPWLRKGVSPPLARWGYPPGRCEQTDRHAWKYYLPPSFGCGW